MLEVAVAEGVVVDLILAPDVELGPPGVVVVGIPHIGVKMEALHVKVEAYLTRRSRWQGLDLCTALCAGLVVANGKALILGGAFEAREDGGDRR